MAVSVLNSHQVFLTLLLAWSWGWRRVVHASLKEAIRRCSLSGGPDELAHAIAKMPKQHLVCVPQPIYRSSVSVSPARFHDSQRHGSAQARQAALATPPTVLRPTFLLFQGIINCPRAKSTLPPIALLRQPSYVSDCDPSSIVELLSSSILHSVPHPGIATWPTSIRSRERGHLRWLITHVTLHVIWTDRR
ncbi:hypothetical protein BD310DRAFT_488715 [Dichomitus squalens]|uniref:Secreted protein n=1 Tax=Dichomitus squalens TaxID=114155 RepID=A0A4Q9PUP8_9APHY|nr:hypothetical protein BD310DRAFT_488715 [Dichomitus squalens]